MAYVILYFGGWWLMRIYAGIKQDLDFHRQCVDDAGLPASPCVRLKDPSFRDKQSRFSSGRGCYWRPEKQSLDDFLLNFLDSAFRLVRPKQDLSLEQVFDFCNVTLDHFKPVKSVESLIAEISSRMELIPGLTDLLSIDLSFEPKQNKQKRLIEEARFELHFSPSGKLLKKVLRGSLEEDVLDLRAILGEQPNSVPGFDSEADIMPQGGLFEPAYRRLWVIIALIAKINQVRNDPTQDSTELDSSLS